MPPQSVRAVERALMIAGLRGPSKDELVKQAEYCSCEGLARTSWTAAEDPIVAVELDGVGDDLGTTF